MERFISRFVCVKNNGFSYRRMTISVSSHSRLVILANARNHGLSKLEGYIDPSHPRECEEPLFLEWRWGGKPRIYVKQSFSKRSSSTCHPREREDPLFLEWLLRGTYAALLRFIAYKAYVVAEVFVNAREFEPWILFGFALEHFALFRSDFKQNRCTRLELAFCLL